MGATEGKVQGSRLRGRWEARGLSPGRTTRIINTCVFRARSRPFLFLSTLTNEKHITSCHICENDVIYRCLFLRGGDLFVSVFRVLCTSYKHQASVPFRWSWSLPFFNKTNCDHGHHASFFRGRWSSLSFTWVVVVFSQLFSFEKKKEELSASGLLAFGWWCPLSIVLL